MDKEFIQKIIEELDKKSDIDELIDAIRGLTKAIENSTVVYHYHYNDKPYYVAPTNPIYSETRWCSSTDDNMKCDAGLSEDPYDSNPCNCTNNPYAKDNRMVNSTFSFRKHNVQYGDEE